MLIKNNGCSINFIDENDVFLGYEYVGSCCEYFGYIINTDGVYTVDYDNSDNGDDFELDGYIFDIKFNGESSDSHVKFKLVKEGHEDLYLILFNEHNGYYGHGFEFKVGDQTLLDGYI